MKIDEKGVFLAIAILLILFSIILEVEASTIFLMLGIVIALFFSYGDLTRA